MFQEIQSGDIVYLEVGGPPMRVLAVRHFDETCYCEWLVEGKPERAFFLLADLTHISFITRLQARPQA